MHVHVPVITQIINFIIFITVCTLRMLDLLVRILECARHGCQRSHPDARLLCPSKLSVICVSYW